MHTATTKKLMETSGGSEETLFGFRAVWNSAPTEALASLPAQTLRLTRNCCTFSTRSFRRNHLHRPPTPTPTPQQIDYIYYYYFKKKMLIFFFFFGGGGIFLTLFGLFCFFVLFVYFSNSLWAFFFSFFFFFSSPPPPPPFILISVLLCLSVDSMLALLSHEHDLSQYVDPVSTLTLQVHSHHHYYLPTDNKANVWHWTWELHIVTEHHSLL